MKTISILTVKGGVGKTTTSIHLGAAFAEQGKKVLVIDLDPQVNLTIGYKIPDEEKYTIKEFIEHKFDNFNLYEKSKKLFIMKGSPFLDESKYKHDSLKLALEILEKNNIKFDIVIIDCPPRPVVKDSLTKIALLASDYLISPILANEYSISGINSLFTDYLEIKKNANKNINFLGFFFNNVRENTVLFKKYRRMGQENVPDYLFKKHIRQDMLVEYSIEKGTTVFEQKSNSRIAEDYRSLSKEILKKIA